LLQKLAWDSAYFGTATFRLFTGLFDERVTTRALAQAATKLRQQLAARQGAFYAFTIVPAEDIQILQGLTSAGWRLVETRSTYYREQLQGFEFPRFPVRTASMQEALQIGQIAAAARNPYDRVHADEWFGNARADAYLRKYAENAVLNKLATTVLVPDETALPVDSFLAIKDLEADSEVLGVRMSRVLLTAVGPLNQGWHVKLVAETVHRAQALGHDAVLMTTQATNRAVLRTCEKLGFQLGATSHVLACHNS
jgi:dTDP-4-amino-4,6-dideoxy-D-galactose acyltransferase